MSSTITINKLLNSAANNTVDSKNYIYLKIKWEDEQFSVKILDSENGKSYQGTVTATAMKEIASNLDISYNEYYEEMRSALTTYLALPGFYYKLEPDMEVLNVWKSQPEAIPILFLDINIKEVRRSSYEILDSAIELLQQQDKSLNEKVEKAHKFDEHSRELLEDYRLCVEEKNELEKKLLKKVAVLLNAKKERIAELEERLRKYEEVEDGPDDNDSEENEDAPQTNKRRRLVVRDSESDEDDEFMADTQPLTIPPNGDD